MWLDGICLTSAIGCYARDCRFSQYKFSELPTLWQYAKFHILFAIAHTHIHVVFDSSTADDTGTCALNEVKG